MGRMVVSGYKAAVTELTKEKGSLSHVGDTLIRANPRMGGSLPLRPLLVFIALDRKLCAGLAQIPRFLLESKLCFHFCRAASA